MSLGGTLPATIELIKSWPATGKNRRKTSKLPCSAASMTPMSEQQPQLQERMTLCFWSTCRCNGKTRCWIAEFWLWCKRWTRSSRTLQCWWTNREWISAKRNCLRKTRSPIFWKIWTDLNRWCTLMLTISWLSIASWARKECYRWIWNRHVRKSPASKGTRKPHSAASA